MEGVFEDQNNPALHRNREEQDAEEDEFVVIHETSADDSSRGIHHRERQISPQYIEKSQPASEYGSNEVADVGDALSVGGTTTKTPFNSVMNSSSASLNTQQAPMLDSNYLSFYSFDSTAKVDKLMEYVQESRGEQEKYGGMLEQVHSILSTQFDKEKATNSELRSKCEEYACELESAKAAISDFQSQFLSVRGQSAREMGEAAERVNQLSQEVQKKDELIAQLQAQLSSMGREQSELQMSLTECTQQLEIKKKETENQAEIINVLSEEQIESKRFFDESRKVYRERLNQLEAQVASMYERNEVADKLRGLHKVSSGERVNIVDGSQMPSTSTQSVEASGRHPTPKATPTIFICERCLCAFPKNGTFVAHRNSPRDCQ